MMAQEARRAAAILDADVTGHARGTVTAESDWTARLAQHSAERLEPAVVRHGGRVIGVTDKGVRAEFPTAAQALGAAIAFQQAMAEANRGQDAGSAIVFGVGLRLAEARQSNGWPMEQPSQSSHPSAGGGIVVSAPLRDALAGQVKASFAELGSAGLGTVERPVHTYEVGWDPADWPAASAAAARPIPQNGQKRMSLWPVLVAALVALSVLYLADAPRSPPAVIGVPRLTAEELQRLQEHAMAAFALWQEGKAQEEAELDEPADQDAKADNAAPTDDYDGFYTGTLSMRADGHLGTITVRVSHGVGSGTENRLDCGTVPVSLRISSSGDVSGVMRIFGPTCLRTELAIRGRAVPGTLRLRLGSHYVELAKQE
jgi:class 3 adenylate cyclase